MVVAVVAAVGLGEGTKLATVDEERGPCEGGTGAASDIMIDGEVRSRVGADTRPLE